MCRESPDSYLNKISKINENPMMRYLHTARSALTSLKLLGKQEPFFTPAEFMLLILAEDNVYKIIDLVYKRLANRDLP